MFRYADANDFAHGLEEEDGDRVVFLRAERSEGGERTFRMVEARPLDTSFGEDLFRKYFFGAAEASAEGADRRPAA